jgi:hypothetical protein
VSRWRNGEADVERLLAARDLDRVTGAQADGVAWVDKARRTLDTARAIAADDPESAFVLAYDAARHACTGLLAHQGLRPTTKGGHYTVEQAVRAQFGEAFKPFAALRRRRNELEYPAFPGERIESDETDQAVADAVALVDAADALLPNLGLF